MTIEQVVRHLIAEHGDAAALSWACSGEVDWPDDLGGALGAMAREDAVAGRAWASWQHDFFFAELRKRGVTRAQGFLGRVGMIAFGERGYLGTADRKAGQFWAEALPALWDNIDAEALRRAARAATATASRRLGDC